MQVEVGEIYEGKVTGITKFGAFVEFAEGKTGMVHISEVASQFVKEITDFVKVGQAVKVKVLAIAQDGKISLSMKKAEPAPERPTREKQERSRDNQENRQRTRDNRRNARGEQANTQSARPGDFEWQSKPNAGGSFEDMMSRFKMQSDEKISDLKKSTETKRGGFGTRRDTRNN